MKRGRKTDECARKRLRYRKTFVWWEWISRLLRCVHRGNFYWFSVRSDSQRSFHTRYLTLNPTFLDFDHILLFLPPIVLSWLEVVSPSVHRYLKMISCITVPLSSIPLLISPIFSLYFSLSLSRASFLFSDDAWHEMIEDRSKTRAMNIK